MGQLPTTTTTTQATRQGHHQPLHGSTRMTLHHDPETLRQAAVTSARLGGCNCAPDVDITEGFEGVYHATIAHDRDCRLLLRRVARWN